MANYSFRIVKTVPIVQSYVIHDPEPIRPSFNLLSDDDYWQCLFECLSSCIQFSVWVCFWVRLCLCDLFVALFCVRDFWSRTSLTAFCKWLLLFKLLQMQLLFWYAVLLVLINCWVRVVSVSSVFSFMTFDNDFKLIMITIVLCLDFACLLVLFFRSEWFLINLNCILSRRRTLQSVTSRGFRMLQREEKKKTSNR